MVLPPEESLRWLVSRYAGLIARHGDGIGTPELVQPTGEYFPDVFTPSGDGVARLVARLLEYTPVRDGLDVRLRFVESDAEDTGACGTSGCGAGGCGSKGCSGGSCGSGGGASKAGGCGAGGCGTSGAKAVGALRERVIEADGGYLLELPVEAVGNAVVLTTTLARAAGTLVLAEAGEEVGVDELGGMSEVAAIAAGLGVLVIGGAHVYGKSCGGASVSHHTHLSVEEAAVGLALFAAHHGLRPAVAKRHLETTQNEAFGDAYDWVESNPGIVTQLRTRPEVLEAGMFRCEETKGFFGKLLARRAASEEESAFAFTPARGRNSV